MEFSAPSPFTAYLTVLAIAVLFAFLLAALLLGLRCDMRDFWEDQAEWSNATFGDEYERGPAGPLKHLAKEVQECLENQDDLEEYADLLFLVFDATRRAGFTYHDLNKALWLKLTKNKARQWPKPTSSDEPVEHIRS